MKYSAFFETRIIYDKLKYKAVWSRGLSHDLISVTFGIPISKLIYIKFMHLENLIFTLYI